ncbi:unnamed protein product [Protopolystoma xenopodis]|uniref:PDEase domain-containing protein n=1 Tax=Protopolystoma xenopodis TaxID=117903 RepID=A0A448XI78_9PLAT|nr:unnamed protein product [Protopolystoma xenopodis]
MKLVMASSMRVRYLVWLIYESPLTPFSNGMSVYTFRFFLSYRRQASVERAMGLPVLPFMDPAKVTKAGSQIGFIKFVLLPLLEEVIILFPSLKEPILDPVKRQLEFYQKQQHNQENQNLQDRSHSVNFPDNSQGSGSEKQVTLVLLRETNPPPSATLSMAKSPVSAATAALNSETLSGPTNLSQAGQTQARLLDSCLQGLSNGIAVNSRESDVHGPSCLTSRLTGDSMVNSMPLSRRNTSGDAYAGLGVPIGLLRLAFRVNCSFGRTRVSFVPETGFDQFVLGLTRQQVSA